MKLLPNIFKKKRYSNNNTPHLLFLEPTNLCNLNCSFCLVNIDSSYPDSSHNSMKRSLGLMNMNLFDKIIVDAKAFGIKQINMEFWGEPFLHPHIDEMICRTSKAGFITSIFTNGLAIKEKHLKVISNNLDAICLSIDGASEEAYKLNRIGGNFMVVWENLIKLSELCRDTKTSVRWQFIVMQNNEHEIPKAKQLARKHNLNLVLKTFNPSVKELITSKKNISGML